MARKRTPGLIKRPVRKGGQIVGYVYRIDKIIRGRRICESCETSDPEEAERYLARRMEKMRQAEVYGYVLSGPSIPLPPNSFWRISTSGVFAMTCIDLKESCLISAH